MIWVVTHIERIGAEEIWLLLGQNQANGQIRNDGNGQVKKFVVVVPKTLK